ncbi:MAG: hypothetical protein KAI79_16890 [Bacteroidales bacterium]|nr:hypothetical protein [Bacteroidales bacterium]
MDVKLIVVESAIKWLVGGDLLEFVKDAVAKVNDASLSGAEKREAVFAESKEMFADFASVFISLAIEVAVILLRAELETDTAES